MKAILCTLLISSLLFSLSVQDGTFFLDNIVGNGDVGKVQVEQNVFDDNKLQVTNIVGLAPTTGGKSEGTFVERVNHKDGSMSIPENLLVQKVATVTGLFRPNGGLRADNGASGASFTIQNDTGITTIVGETRPNGGIAVNPSSCADTPYVPVARQLCSKNEGLFYVEDDTGRTTIEEVLRPNGGVNVNNGKFTISRTVGKVLTQGGFTVEKDIILGTDQPNLFMIERVLSITQGGGNALPGNTIYQGQDAKRRGGDIVLEPGFPREGSKDGKSGKIIIGPLATDTAIVVGRPAVAEDAGLTIIHGQDSTHNAGGDLEFKAGDGVTQGGHLILNVGATTTAQQLLPNQPEIIVGAPFQTDLLMRRPTITGPIAAGSTTIRGQKHTGVGGVLNLKGGDPGLNKVGGHIRLQPGIDSNRQFRTQRIIIGDTRGSDTAAATGRPILVTRIATPNEAGLDGTLDGGRTSLVGQTAQHGAGGDIAIEAGSAAVGAQVQVTTSRIGGNVNLVTGFKQGAGVPGIIFIGNEDEDLVIKRPTTDVDVPFTTTGAVPNQVFSINPVTTTIEGQNQVNANQNGGLLAFKAGTAVSANPASRSGAVFILGADAADTFLDSNSHGGLGGSVNIRPANSLAANQNGAGVSIKAGSSRSGVPVADVVNANGGNILIRGGTAVNTDHDGGNIKLNAGADGIPNPPIVRPAQPPALGVAYPTTSKSVIVRSVGGPAALAAARLAVFNANAGALAPAAPDGLVLNNVDFHIRELREATADQLPRFFIDDITSRGANFIRRVTLQTVDDDDNLVQPGTAGVQSGSTRFAQGQGNARQGVLAVSPTPAAVAVALKVQPSPADFTGAIHTGMQYILRERWSPSVAAGGAIPPEQIRAELPRLCRRNAYTEMLGNNQQAVNNFGNAISPDNNMRHNEIASEQSALVELLSNYNRLLCTLNGIGLINAHIDNPVPALNNYCSAPGEYHQGVVNGLTAVGGAQQQVARVN